MASRSSKGGGKKNRIRTAAQNRRNRLMRRREGSINFVPF